MRGSFFYNNGRLCEASEWNDVPQQGVVVYEVLRIIRNVPLFFNDHYERMVNSCRLVNQTCGTDQKTLFQRINQLAVANSFSEGNVTIKQIFNPSAANPVEELIYFIPHAYPTEQQYRDGVTVGFLHAERNNPEAKVEQGVRDKANEMLSGSGLYEVLLVDHNGYITEGSRSNMVFVKGDVLYTCPLNRVLTGITLKKVIDLAAAEGIPLRFEAVGLNDVVSCDALFITGTSPKILPVACAGEVCFDVGNPVMRRLMDGYNNLVISEEEKGLANL